LLPLGILAIGLIIAVALFVAGVIHSGKLGLELAKGGIQLLVVVILGSAVAFGFRNLDERRVDQRRMEDDHRTEQRRKEDVAREERLRVDDYRAKFVDELWAAYNRVKAVRRTLSAYGFGTRAEQLTGEFTEEQCQEYGRQMKELDDAQLTLETLKRKVETDDGRLFGRNRAAIHARVESAESYVNKVIGDWEHHRDDVRPGNDRATAMDKQTNLSKFFGSARADGGIKTGLTESIGEAVRLVQEIRFSPDPSETS
jgi:membrane protein implicated in regulation of membrane protease activity